MAQTDSRWEQIVIDDGSEDGTEAIVRTIDDPRIRYVRLDHRGISHLAESYNVALQMSRGAFVAVLEGDDFWPVDKIERQLRHFHRPETILTWGVAAIADEAGEVRGTFPNSAAIHMGVRSPGETIRSLLKGNFIPAGTVMCRRESLIRIGGFQQPHGIPTTDYPTWLELCRIGWFTPINEVLGVHRAHAGQTSVRMKAEMDLVLDWGVQFIERLPDGERVALGLSIAEACRIKRDRSGYLQYEAGRTALAHGDTRHAQAMFRQALRDGSRATGLKASIGLGCSYLGLDLEAIAKATRTTLRR